jgi:hypothetical protein
MKMNFTIFVLLIYHLNFFIRFIVSNDEKNLIVETLNGPVRGKYLQVDSKTRIRVWLGIPYAQKPLNDLRFKRPVSITTWNEILNTTQLPNSCPQRVDKLIKGFQEVEKWNANTPMSEDCLYLNIWAPEESKPEEKSAVIVKFMVFRIKKLFSIFSHFFILKRCNCFNYILFFF